MSITCPEATVSAARKPNTTIDFSQEFEIDGCHYRVTAANASAITDAVTVAFVGIGPGGEATDGHFTVHTSALPHLGRVLTRTINGLAALHSVTAPPTRRERRKRRRPDKPGNSHQPWTPDLDTRLTQAWQAARRTRPARQLATELAEALNEPVAVAQRHFEHPDTVPQPEQIIAAIAAIMQRTPGAISSRLTKLGFDPVRVTVP